MLYTYGDLTTSSPMEMARRLVNDHLTPVHFSDYLRRECGCFTIGEQSFEAEYVLRSRPGAYEEEYARYRSDVTQRLARRLRRCSCPDTMVWRDQAIRITEEPPEPADGGDNDGVGQSDEPADPDTELTGYVVKTCDQTGNTGKHWFDTLPEALEYASVGVKEDGLMLLRVTDASTGERVETETEESATFSFDPRYPGEVMI